MRIKTLKDFEKQLNRDYKRRQLELDEALEDYGDDSGPYLYAKGYLECIETYLGIIEMEENSNESDLQRIQGHDGGS